MSNLKLRLLGGYEGSFASGEALALPTRKGWGLLAYLAIQSSGEVSRAKLAALFWGERSETQARASLRQTLYEIRGALGEALADRVTARRDAVGWNGEGIDVDVGRLEALVASERTEDLAAVASIYRGPLLDGLDLDEAGFGEWLAAERARLEELAAGALEGLALAQLDQGSPEPAIATAQQLIRIDPLREKAHRLLMQALAAAGRRSDALRRFQDLQVLLRDELGVDPDAETLQLHHALLRRDAAVGPEGQTARADEQPDIGVAAPARSATPRPSRSWRTATVGLIGLLLIGAVGSGASR